MVSLLQKQKVNSDLTIEKRVQKDTLKSVLEYLENQHSYPEHYRIELIEMVKSSLIK